MRPAAKLEEGTPVLVRGTSASLAASVLKTSNGASTNFFFEKEPHFSKFKKKGHAEEFPYPAFG